MTTPTPAQISEERLRELRSIFSFDDGYVPQVEQDVLSLIDAELTRRSQAQPVGRWIPWRPGDALPATAPVLHWTTWFDKEYTDVPMMRANHAHDFERWGVTAYWSEPLPPPYDALTPTAPAPQGSPVAAEPSWDALIDAADAFKLPVDVKIGAGTFRKGVKVGTAIRCLKNHAGYPSEIPDSEYPTFGTWLPDIASPAPQGEKCGTCDGQGEVFLGNSRLDGQTVERCDACNGTGQQPAEAVGEAGELREALEGLLAATFDTARMRAARDRARRVIASQSIKPSEVTK